MSFGIKREKDKLALRLTRSYAGLFAAVFLLLTAMVYLVFYRFLIRTQSQNLATTLELTVDHILEEMEEERRSRIRAFSRNRTPAPIFLFTCRIAAEKR